MLKFRKDPFSGSERGMGENKTGEKQKDKTLRIKK
jgi:hypothetical protein